MDNPLSLEKLAGALTERQREAILWCNADGTPRTHVKGAPSRTSFYCLMNVVKGDPTKRVATIAKLVVRGDAEKRRGQIWPDDTWRLTPLGLALRQHLQNGGGE